MSDSEIEDSQCSWNEIIGNFPSLKGNKFNKDICEKIKIYSLMYYKQAMLPYKDHISYDPKFENSNIFPESTYYSYDDYTTEKKKEISKHTIEDEDGNRKIIEKKRKDIFTISNFSKSQIEFLINRLVLETTDVWDKIVIKIDEGKKSKKIDKNNPVLITLLKLCNENEFTVIKYLINNVLNGADELKYFKSNKDDKSRNNKIDNFDSKFLSKIKVKKLNTPIWQITFINELEDKISDIFNEYLSNKYDDDDENTEYYSHVKYISKIIANIINDFLKIISIKIMLSVVSNTIKTIGNKIFPIILWDLTINIDENRSMGIMEMFQNMKEYAISQNKPRKRQGRKKIIKKNVKSTRKKVNNRISNKKIYKKDSRGIKDDPREPSLTRVRCAPVQSKFLSDESQDSSDSFSSDDQSKISGESDAESESKIKSKNKNKIKPKPKIKRKKNMKKKKSDRNFELESLSDDESDYDS